MAPPGGAECLPSSALGHILVRMAFLCLAVELLYLKSSPGQKWRENRTTCLRLHECRNKGFGGLSSGSVSSVTLSDSVHTFRGIDRWLERPVL